jgi:zinc transport system substrate-binding protein
VVCTIFPQYDWVRQILGSRGQDVELTLLLKDKVDIHSFQPSVEDIVNISGCDLFIYVGGESDEWVEDALAEATNVDMIAINLMEVLGDAVVEEEIVEGMEEEEEEEEGIAYDEHVWLSLRHAQTLTEAIADALAELDAANADEYADNQEAYAEELNALDEQYTEAVDAADINTLLFGDRFPFRYMIDDYGLECFAAFPGCSAETEASFETVVFLANKTNELGLKNVMVLESADQSIAKTIIANTKDKNQEILVMDSLQSVTVEDIDDGATYLELMEENLEVLKSALK